jgi:hypothetical protein
MRFHQDPPLPMQFLFHFPFLDKNRNHWFSIRSSDPSNPPSHNCLWCTES